MPKRLDKDTDKRVETPEPRYRMESVSPHDGQTPCSPFSSSSLPWKVRTGIEEPLSSSNGVGCLVLSSRVEVWNQTTDELSPLDLGPTTLRPSRMAARCSGVASRSARCLRACSIELFRTSCSFMIGASVPCSKLVIQPERPQLRQ